MFGGNFFDEKPLPTYCSLVWEACQDNIIIALIIMATLSFIVELVRTLCLHLILNST